MTKAHLLVAFLPLLSCCHSGPRYYLSPATVPYQAHDLTDEHLFSHNIEGPAFRHDTLFVVNYRDDGTIGTVLPGGRCALYMRLPDSSIANSIKFDDAGNMYLADFTGHNILKIDETKQLSVYCHDDRFHQPNDLCRSSRGFLYASDPDWADSTGRIWRIDSPGRAAIAADSMGTTNGLCLSPDEKRLYVGESDQRKIWVFAVDSAGGLHDKRLFASFQAFGMDGMHCDPAGNLYVCRYGKGTIAVFSPEGALTREIKLKGKNCSNFVFGDADGRTAFVTLQDRRGMEMFRIE